MRAIELSRSLGRGVRHDRSKIVQFVENTPNRHGTRALSDHLWLELSAADPEHDQAGDGRPSWRALTISNDDTIEAYAQVSVAPGGAVLESVLPPDHPDADELLGDLVDTAVDTFRRAGGGVITWWVDDDAAAPAALADVAQRNDLAVSRTLHELRRPLPYPERATIVTRGLRAGDEGGVLRVNNLAFAGHPEQGAWTPETLATRFAQPWFASDGVRIYEHDGQIAAFCWTKRHTTQLGEIYVIGVDPALHGRGLGRQLTLAGLDWLADGGCTSATLWVDAGNAAAMAMYHRLGFQLHRTRLAITGTLEAL